MASIRTLPRRQPATTGAVGQTMASGSMTTFGGGEAAEMPYRPVATSSGAAAEMPYRPVASAAPASAPTATPAARPAASVPNQAPASAQPISRARTLTPPPMPATPAGGAPAVLPQARTAQAYNQAAYDASTRTAWEGRAGQTNLQGRNPYNPNAPRYQGIDDEDILWAQTATTARRPDGSYVYKASERNYAEEQILKRMRDQDRDLADPMSGTSLRGRAGAFMTTLDGQMQRGERDYDAASGAYDRGDADTERRITRMEDFSPTEQEGFDTSFLRDLAPTAQQGWTPGRLGTFDSTETRNFSPDATRGVSTQSLRGYDAGGAMESYLARNGGGGGWDTSATGATSNFDPRQAVEEYARGAAMQSKYVLADALRGTANAAARSGRLNTGLFDWDQGTVIRRVGEDLNAGILTKAVDAAGIRANIENANTRNLTDASIASARERGSMGSSLAGLRSAEARDAARLELDAVDAATGYELDQAETVDKFGLERAGTIDKNALTAADATARYTLDQAQGVDDFRLKGATSYGDLELKRRTGVDDARYAARRDAADASVRNQSNRLERLSLADKLWGGATDRVGDAISGERDRVTADANFERMMSQMSRDQRTQFINSLLQGGTRLATSFLTGGAG